ncbi:MAG TPA: HAMP domain-containing sensor histidine kinase, partial [Polyangiales bacterium]
MMEIFSPELHCFPLRAFLDEAKDKLGDIGLAAVLGRYGLTEAELADSTAWVSLEFVESLLQALVDETHEPDFVERSVMRGMTPKYIGALYPLLFALGSPSFTYKQLAPASARMNKMGHWTLHEVGRGSARLSWSMFPGPVKERNPVVCETRRLQLKHVPSLFSLTSARVEHTECLHKGDACCMYEVLWEEPPERRHAQVGLVIGAALGFAISVLSFAKSWAHPIVALGFALCGWALGRIWMLRQDLKRRLGDIENHNDALARTTRAAEQRYAELLDAKAEVDRKVEQRTTELRGASEQLSLALNRLQELDRAKTDFFNNVSHELRSPLTLILAPLDEIIAGRMSPGAERAAFQTMHRNASRLLRLINQLLDLAKIDAGQMQIAAEPTDLPALVRSSLQGFEAAAQNKGVRLQLRVPDTMSAILLDSSWIDSAITNLLANALRLTKSGGFVQLSVVDQGAEVRVSVSDDGPGIAPDDQKKIFERFAQGDSTKRVVGGTGIGLALVREAARLHGGDVELMSAIGEGSSFTLRLPRRASTGAQAVERSHPSLPPKRVLVEEIQETPQSAERPGPSPTAPLALVVEDNSELRAFIADVLATRYRVVAA